MALSNLFKINSTDLTKFERADVHSVNREDEWEEWTDGNWNTHREICRTRVTGSVVLGFSKETDFSTFISLLTTARNAAGYYPITVWCSNTNTSETVNAFLDVSGDTKWDLTTPRKYHQITVKITGR